MIFPEAMTELAMYRRFKDAVKVPILANITEFGQTPLFTREELASVGVDIVLYCCSAYRAMNAAALDDLPGDPPRRHAEERAGPMQTRADLYRYLDYHAYEDKAGRLFAEGKEPSEQDMSAMPSPHSSPRNPSPCPASPPATPRCAPSAAPATTCTTAATTFSISPTPASSRRSPTCWSTGSCRTAPSWPPTRRKLKALRGLPAAVRDGARAAAAQRAIRWTCCAPASRRSAASCRKAPTHPAEGARDIADRLLACLGSMLCYWYHFSHNGRRIEVETDDDSIGGALPAPAARHASRRRSWVRAMHTSLILYAEHEFNASTFTARVIAGTGSDMYSCITGAIGALRGPKHGGANEVAFEIQKRYDTPDEAEADIRARVADKEIIIGFGHPVYTDLRSAQRSDQGGGAQLSRRGRTTRKLFDDRRAHRDA